MQRDTVIESVNVIPVGVSEDGQRVCWRDVGQCAFTQSFFVWSLETWERQHGVGPSYETELSFLEQPSTGIDVIEPTAFVFHMSRCGSSVLASAVAQCPRVIVMSEPGVINQVLLRLCGAELHNPVIDPLRLRTLRHVIGALGRRRQPLQEYYVVKFSSWNVMLAASIRAAYPEVPCLFVYRNPAEVLVSLLRRPPEWMNDRDGAISRGLTGAADADLKAMMPVEYAARCAYGMMSAGLGMSDAGYVNYTDLTRQSLAVILDYCKIECSSDEFARMAAQFDFDAKSFPRVAPFIGDVAAKQRAATGEIQTIAANLLDDHFRALEASDRNLGAVLRHQGTRA